MTRTFGLLLGIVLIAVPGAAANDVRFPQIVGWQRAAEIQTFGPKTLFEYINGAADLYLACEFEELKVAEYGSGQKASVIVEVYVYDYRNLGMAQDLVLSLGLPSRVCGECILCPVRFSVGFAVREKIGDIVRVREVPAEFLA